MLFSGMMECVALVADEWNTRIATIVAKRTIAAASAIRAAVLPRLVIGARIFCSLLASSRAPAGRAAGSIANIDISSEAKHWGTRAAFSCSIGNGLDRRAF